MRRLLLTLGVLSSMLTGCGGGGNIDTPVPMSLPVPVSVLAPVAVDREILKIAVPAGLTYSATIAPGKFDSANGKYVVVSGIYIGPNEFASTPNPDAPLRILKIDSNGSDTDVTANIIGTNATTPGNVVIADFNGDGIDDIVSLYFKDFPVADKPGSAGFRGDGAIFLSRAGQTHVRRTLTGPSWTHGTTVSDINGDGSLDFINSHGQKWLNDGHGNFTFHDHSWYLNTHNGFWMHGSGVCVGDFNNTGKKQVVITDLSINALTGPISDTVIFELDAALRPIASHSLPVPVLDRNTSATAKEVSHDVQCVAMDLNRDGRLDLLVFSRPDASARNNSWTNEGVVQVLINRGNWNFDDVTDVAMANYPINTLISYSPIPMDLNGDGIMDLWLGSHTYNSTSPNHAWLNNGSGTFTRSLQSAIDSLGANGPMIPVAFGNTYSFVYSKMTSNQLTIYATIARYIFN
jgi:hypothetical protein